MARELARVHGGDKYKDHGGTIDGRTGGDSRTDRPDWPSLVR